MGAQMFYSCKQGWLFGSNYNEIKIKMVLITCKDANKVINIETQAMSILSQK